MCVAFLLESHTKPIIFNIGWEGPPSSWIMEMSSPLIPSDVILASPATGHLNIQTWTAWFSRQKIHFVRQQSWSPAVKYPNPLSVFTDPAIHEKIAKSATPGVGMVFTPGASPQHVVVTLKTIPSWWQVLPSASQMPGLPGQDQIPYLP